MVAMPHASPPRCLAVETPRGAASRICAIPVHLDDTSYVVSGRVYCMLTFIAEAGHVLACLCKFEQHMTGINRVQCGRRKSMT